MHLLLAAVAIVTGLVTVEDAVLPGCTVAITSGSYSATTISGADGKYRFQSVPPGVYELTFRLAGLRDAGRRISVSDGENLVPSQSLELDAPQEITISCGRPCEEERPATRWNLPTCADYELDLSLIEAMKTGDRSARDLLMKRYAHADTWYERHHLGGAVLNHVPNDRAIWSELSEYAALAVRFASSFGPELQPEFVQWCAEREVDPFNYLGMTFDAFTAVSTDPRARPLLLKALTTEESGLVYAAICALGTLRDESSLPIIEEELQKRPEFADALQCFNSERADALAKKYGASYP